MVSIFRRGLFWRVYLTFLGSLVLMAVLMAALWHLMGEPRRVVVVPPGMAHHRGGPHMLGMALAIAATVGLAAYPIVSRLTRRLEALKASLDAWGQGDLATRARVDGSDDIAAVAASFNAAADRVEALLKAHRTLLAHASHELRSPLTRLRMATEMFAANPDPGLRQAIVEDIAELDGLVEEILLASRLDHGRRRRIARRSTAWVLRPRRPPGSGPRSARSIRRTAPLRCWAPRACCAG